MNPLTSSDLSRLVTLLCIHGGSARSIPHGVARSFDALRDAGLVEIKHDELENGLDVHGAITLKGQSVVDAMLATGRKIVEGV